MFLQRKYSAVRMGDGEYILITFVALAIKASMGQNSTHDRAYYLISLARVS